MPIPGSWTTVPVTWNLYGHTGEACNGVVLFTATQVVSAGSAGTFVPDTIRAVVTNGVMAAVSLPATDDPDATPNGWTWTVTALTVPAGPPAFDILVPAAGGTINLATVVPAVTPPTVAQYVPLTQRGAANGVATLDASALIPDAQIPATIARDSEVTTAVAASVPRGDQIRVQKSGANLSVRSQFDATRDVVLPVSLARTSLSTSSNPHVMLCTDAQPWVVHVPSAAADAEVFPTVTAAGAVNMHGPADDDTPINAGNGYVGANHGWNAGSQVTMTGHGKVTADLGSTWSDGTRTYTLLRIIDANTALLGNPYSVSSDRVTPGTTLPAATLTHVAGATNTANITITGGVSLIQIHPSIHSQTATAYLDGKILGDGAATGYELTIVESYLIASYKGLIDWSQANIGVDPFANLAVKTQLARLSHTYKFTGRGTVLVGQTVTMIEAATISMGVTQALGLATPAGGTLREFMPGIGNVTDGTNAYDLRTIATLSGTTGQANVALAEQLTATEPATRAYQWAYDSGGAKSYGILLGLLPVMDGELSVRKVNGTDTRSWWFTLTYKKNYPQLVWLKNVVVGDSFSGVGFRRYLPPDAAAEQVVTDGSRSWVMVDRPDANSTAATAKVPSVIGRALSQVVGTAKTVTPAKTYVSPEGITYTNTAPGYMLAEAVDPRVPGARLSIPGAASAVGSYFVTQSGAVTAVALTPTTTIYLWPMFVPEDTPVDRFCADVTILGTGTVRAGIYAEDPTNGLPVTTGPIADYGTIDVTTTGIKELTLSGVTLPAGWHYFGWVWQGTSTTAPTLRYMSAALGFGPFNIGTSNTLMSGARMCYSAAGAVSGALGALGALTAQQVTPPRIAYRRA